MEKEIIKFIQITFIKITNKSISRNYIKKFLIPLINFINNNRQEKFLLSGSQGVGKSTILKILEKVFYKFFNQKILSLSLDDFYLDKKERLKLSKTKHPLLITRGVPGTHDLSYLQKIINKFNLSEYPIQLPKFEKLNDSRKKTKKIIKNKCNILILEGWCVGCPPIDKNYLYLDINNLEKNFDKKMIWRDFYNNNLKTNYANLFKQFTSIIYLKPSSFSYVLKWRIKQENYLRKLNQHKSFKGMSKKEIIYFIQHYEKISKWMIKIMPSKAKLTLLIDKNQKIKVARLN